jgi:ribosome biogenesis GTPase
MPLFTLESLGWNAAWAARFAPHAAAGCFPGRICVEHKELYRTYSERGEGVAEVSGRLRHEARGRADFPAVGDWVALSQPVAGQLALVHAVLERTNKFSRKAPGRGMEEQIIAANLDTLFLVTSLNRDLNERRIERYLAATGAVPLVLLLNKSDMVDDPGAALAQLRARMPAVPMHALSALTGEGLDALAPYLGAGRTVAMAGSSGVGKSTLLNCLLGETRQSVQETRASDDRGRHTTSHREMIPLPQGGLLIDNPGMRELQPWDEEADLNTPFADIALLAERCRYANCSHQHEPGCAVRNGVAHGTLAGERLESYFKLERELAYQERREDPQAERQLKEKWKKIHRQYNKEQRRRGRL